MTNRTKIIITAVAILAVGVIAYAFSIPKKAAPISNPPTATNEPVTRQPPSGPLVDLSKIDYGTKTTIPGTGVTFSYPSKGFFGQGAELSSAEHFGTVFDGIEYINLASSAQNAKQQTEIAVYKLQNEKTLEDVATTLKGEFSDTDLSLGFFQTVAGTRYFLLPSAYNADTFRAYAIVNGHLLEVTFDGGFDSKLDGTVPDFITQFISRLDFTCPEGKDCSVNSAPVVNMDKYRNGNTE